MLVGSGCMYPSVVESFAWFLYISSPWYSSLFATVIAIDGGVGGVLDHGLCFDRSVALTFEGGIDRRISGRISCWLSLVA